MKPKSLLLLLWLLLMAALLVSGSCSSGGSSTSQTGCMDVSGVWTATVTVDATNCEEGVSTNTYATTIAQDGCTITITTPMQPYSGTITGDTMSWVRTYPEDNGTTTETGTVTITETTMAGSATWEWVGPNPGESCSGTTVFTANKL